VISDLETISKETLVDSFHELYRHFPADTEENHENLQSVSRVLFEYDVRVLTIQPEQIFLRNIDVKKLQFLQ
jgi:hypothetical protein